MRSFPFRYTDRIVLYHENKETELGAHQKIEHALGLQQDATTSGWPFLGKTNIEINVKIDAVSIAVVYSINLRGNNLLLLLCILTGLFLGINNYNTITIAIILLAVAGYITMIVFQNAHVKRLIIKALNQPQIEGETSIWDKQKRWLHQPEVCPACGATRNEYSNRCLACGIKLPQTKHIKSNTNICGSNHYNINYQYKEQCEK